MSSLARRHRERALAAALAGQDAPPLALAAHQGPAASEYAMMLAQLGEDQRQLHEIQSVERKIAAKRDMAPHFDAWIDGALAAGRDGKAVEDEVVTTMLIWHIDIGQWPRALDLANHVLNHGLALPERYKRTTACLIAEEIAEASLADVMAVDHDVLIAVEDLTQDHDMPDQARAKLFKAIGRKRMAMLSDFDGEAVEAGGKTSLIGAALDALSRALILDKHVGVKKDIEAIERELKKAVEAQNAPAA